MISSYRLGDLYMFGQGMGTDNIESMKRDHPGSIGQEYASMIESFATCRNLIQMTQIVQRHLNRHRHLLPPDIETSTVVHVRLGDVVSGTEDHERSKRPFHIDKLAYQLPAEQSVYVIGKCFFAQTSSSNRDECVEASEVYLRQVLERLNAVHFDGGNADVDLCCAVKAKTFVQGRGFFSKLIVDIRRYMGLTSIENEVCMGYDEIYREKKTDSNSK